ncbi:hypothetical protein FOL47_010334 [Perkinsus chesapeaki]|uniref:RRM domain-containing protein n=1 Tax=Perkinsus chesapeaki TaxID=330153 RepID=A0A7J6L2K9_PERCH|nr:hypothetical protein FOL47_010334 [Perkinsus chesapeaki]
MTDRMTGRSRGFAYCTYSNPEEAQNACNGGSNNSIEGHWLDVKPATRDPAICGIHHTNSSRSSSSRGGGGGRGGGGMQGSMNNNPYDSIPFGYTTTPPRPFNIGNNNMTTSPTSTSPYNRLSASRYPILPNTPTMGYRGRQLGGGGGGAMLPPSSSATQQQQQQQQPAAQYRASPY